MMFKRFNAWFHLWFGIISGIIVLILGITGCILVFEPELKSISSPWLHANAAGRALLPPSYMYKAAASALPGKKIRSVWYHGEGRAAVVSSQSDSLVYVNPYTAEIIALRDHEDIFDFVKDGHYFLWLPEKVGHQVTGWGTLVFFVLCLSGLILWWPKRWNKRALKQSFSLKFNARAKRLNYDLHNVLGFYALSIAIVFALTGMMMSFAWFNNSVFKVAGGVKKERIKAVSDTLHTLTTDRLAQADKAWHMGITEIGEHNKKDIIVGYASKDSDPIYLCTDMYRGTWRDVYLDQHTLKVLPASNGRMRDLDLADWIRRSNYGIHVGEIGGLSTKIIYFLASLICASLPVTGFIIWWGRKRKTSRKPEPKRKPLLV